MIAAGGEQRLHGVGGGRTEQLERLLLGRDQRDLDVAGTVLAQVARRSSARARTAAAATFAQRASASATDLARPVIRSSSRPRRTGTSPRPRKVKAPGNGARGTAPVATTRRRTGSFARRRSRRSGSRASTSASVPCTSSSAALIGEDLGQVVHARLRAVERLGDGHRTVDELPLGRQQGDVDQMAGELSQRQQRLESGDAASGDHDMNALARAHDAQPRLPNLRSRAACNVRSVRVRLSRSRASSARRSLRRADLDRC